MKGTVPALWRLRQPRTQRLARAVATGPSSQIALEGEGLQLCRHFGDFGVRIPHSIIWMKEIDYLDFREDSKYVPAYPFGVASLEA